MENIQQISNKLKDYLLWFDGTITVSSNQISNLILDGIELSKIFVDELTDEITHFNQMSDLPISVKENIGKLNTQFNLPSEYLALDVVEYVCDKLYAVLDHFDEPDKEIRIARVKKELKMYKKRNLIPLLQTLIYIINTLSQNGIVWGVGRGSSVSSYVLYLIGVHDIDSIEYDLHIEDFLKG